MTPVEWLMEPMQAAFMQRALIAVVLVGAVSAVVGTYVVLRGMAFLGDALSHAILPGVAVGYLVHGPSHAALFWWSLATALATSLGIGAISRRTQLKEDTAIGILFAGMFALGIALISTMRSYATDLTHILFGNVLAVTERDLWLIAGFGGFAVLMVFLFHKELLVVSFDPVLAATLRLPAAALHYLLLVLIAIAIVVALQAVGVALMLAMLVTPPATAYLLARRLRTMIPLAAGLGAFSGVSGLYLSYYLGMASGAAIVLVSTGLFLIALVFKPARK
jgi:manganese/iron transport system permease protein